jgi:hypothetical protein
VASSTRQIPQVNVDTSYFIQLKWERHALHPRHRLWPHLHEQEEDQRLNRARQKLAIKEVDGIWLISFMHHDPGYIDLEQKALQTIDNPFGPRLSPMS